MSSAKKKSFFTQRGAIWTRIIDNLVEVTREDGAGGDIVKVASWQFSSVEVAKEWFQLVSIKIDALIMKHNTEKISLDTVIDELHDLEEEMTPTIYTHIEKERTLDFFAREDGEHPALTHMIIIESIGNPNAKGFYHVKQEPDVITEIAKITNDKNYRIHKMLIMNERGETKELKVDFVNGKLRITLKED